MAAQKKPTAQQIAQGKARAGGNNPVKVTKAGVKRLGQAALIAASLTPAGRGVKAAVTATKAAKAVKTAKAVTKAKEAAKTAKIAKSSVKATPPQKAAVRLEKNAAQESKVRTAKSGKWAKSQAKADASKFEKQSPYLENDVMKIRSASTKPYKITGGAGSTARNSKNNEIIDTRKLKKK